jgi:hypothetical protein
LHGIERCTQIKSKNVALIPQFSLTTSAFVVYSARSDYGAPQAVTPPVALRARGVVSLFQSELEKKWRRIREKDPDVRISDDAVQRDAFCPGET